MNKKGTLESILNPTSVAIAGVAPGNSGQAFLDSLLDSGFKGKVYLLNPKGGEIEPPIQRPGPLPLTGKTQ